MSVNANRYQEIILAELDASDIPNKDVVRELLTRAHQKYVGRALVRVTPVGLSKIHGPSPYEIIRLLEAMRPAAWDDPARPDVPAVSTWWTIEKEALDRMFPTDKRN